MNPPVLDGYQAELLDRIRAAIRRGARRILVVAPTGAGKTEMIAEIAAGAARRAVANLLIAHRDTLIRQPAAKYRARGVSVGTVTSGARAMPCLSKIGMVQTLRRRRGRPETVGYGLIQIDEAHHSITPAYVDLVDDNGDAIVIGWTASPVRLDRRGLGVECGGMFDTLIVGPSVADLIGWGYLVGYHMHGPEASQEADLSTVGTTASGEFDKRSMGDVLGTDRIIGATEENYRRITPGLPHIVFCCHVAHAERTAEVYRARGWNAAPLHGKMTPAAIRETLTDLAAGRLHTVTSCDLIGEGVDLPNVAAITKLRRTQSLALNIQWDGRPLRVLPGTRGSLSAIAASAKPCAHIFDMAGNWQIHHLPDTPRIWTLEGRKAKSADDFERTAKQCPECQAVHHADLSACPECGHKYAAPSAPAPEPAPHEDFLGVVPDLVLITPDHIEAIKNTPLKVLIKKAKTIESLTSIEKIKGYKEGWAKNMLKRKEQAYIRHRYGTHR